MGPKLKKTLETHTGTALTILTIVGAFIFTNGQNDSRLKNIECEIDTAKVERKDSVKTINEVLIALKEVTTILKQHTKDIERHEGKLERLDEK